MNSGGKHFILVKSAYMPVALATPIFKVNIPTTQLMQSRVHFGNNTQESKAILMENRTPIATATTTLPQQEEQQRRNPSIFFPFDMVVDLLIDIMDGFNG
jgi:hypothetical protein